MKLSQRYSNYSETFEELMQSSHEDNTKDRIILSCPSSMNGLDRAGLNSGTVNNSNVVQTRNATKMNTRRIHVVATVELPLRESVLLFCPSAFTRRQCDRAPYTETCCVNYA